MIARNPQVILIAGLLFALPALGQDVPDSVDVTFDPIEVEAVRSRMDLERTPRSLSMRDLSDRQTVSSPSAIAEALAFLPGLYMADRENLALGERLSIRGMGWRAAFGVRGVHVLLDGIPLTMPDGQTALDIIEPAHLEHAELLRGPSSTIWGNASGGVLSLSTQSPESSPTLSIGSSVGSNGLRRLEATTALHNRRSRLSAYATHFERDGFRTYSRATRTRAGITFRRQLTSRSAVDLNGALIDSPTTNHPGSLTAEQAAEDPSQADPRYVSTRANEDGFQGQAGLRYQRWGQSSLASLYAYGVIRNLDNRLPFAVIDLGRKAGGIRASYDRQFDNVDWIFGADIGIQKDDRLNFDNVDGSRGPSPVLDQVETVVNASGFSRLTVRHQAWLATAALRVDRMRFKAEDQLISDGDQSGVRSFLAVSPSAGISLTSAIGVPFVSIGTAFESPTTTELVNRPDGTGGFNQQLEPQRTTGVEIGIRELRPVSSVDASIVFFAMRVSGLLSPFQTAAGGDRTFYRNQGKTSHRGLEMGVEWQHRDSYQLEIVYDLSQLRFLDGQLEGNRLPGIPQHRVRTGLSINRLGIFGRLELEGMTSMQVDDENSASANGYVLAHLSIGCPRLPVAGDWYLNPFLEVRNLADANVIGSVVVNARGNRYYEPAAGRTWRFGVRLGVD